MKTEIKLIREISYAEGEQQIMDVPAQKIEITLDGDATLSELLSQFESFVRGMGYVPPEHSILDFVSTKNESTEHESNCFCAECDCQHP